MRVLAIAVTSLVSGRALAQRPVAPATVAAPVTDSTRWARVTYLAGRSVYVSAGRDDGLEPGALADVVRGGSAIATLRAVVVSSHRASCEVVRGDSTAVAVGDSVRFVVAATVPVAGIGARDTLATAAARDTDRTVREDSSLSASGIPGETARSRRGAGLRGRIGVRYLVVAEGDSGAARFSQPAADIRIDGTRIGGSPLGVTVDARGRRTLTSRDDTLGTRAASRTYVYQMSASLATPGGGRIAVGRQFSEAFANVSLYDGVSAELARRHWGTGLFAGTQPAPSTMSYSRDVREYGTYVQAHDAGAGSRRWLLTVGAIGSYHANDPNREFGFGQFVLTSTRLSVFATQEVDYNRGWKTAAGERTVQPTSTFLSAQLRPTPAVTVFGGFDTRRNVRLWRDLENPETEFDDRFRQGMWGGASVRAGAHVRLSADIRSSDGGSDSTRRALATSAALALDRIGWSLLGLRSRTTRYTSPWVEGWLHSGSVAVAPLGGQLRFELEGGLRDEKNRPGTSVTGTLGNARVQWVSLDTEVALGRSWYVMLSGTRETGAWADVHQGYASLSWRF
jgi:hypothetical protein